MADWADGDSDKRQVHLKFQDVAAICCAMEKLSADCIPSWTLQSKWSTATFQNHLKILVSQLGLITLFT